MKYRVVLQICAVVIVLLITWAITNNSFDVHKTARDFLGIDYPEDQMVEPTVPKIKCNLEKGCSPNHFAVRIKSGAANVVGPTICFEGQNVMSHVMNNVGPGLNIVVVNDETETVTATVQKYGFLNIRDGNLGDILSYLKGIEPGRIVLLASFDDFAAKMTDEMRDILSSMGSSLIKEVKSKDNWVFAGRVGMTEKSPFEKLAANDAEKNVYEGWPEVVEISGCFPKMSANISEG